MVTQIPMDVVQALHPAVEAIRLEAARAARRGEIARLLPYARTYASDYSDSSYTDGIRAVLVEVGVTGNDLAETVTSGCDCSGCRADRDEDDEDDECDERDRAMSCCGYCPDCETHHPDTGYNDEVCSMGHCHNCDHDCESVG